jgi:hypothetical protein
MVMGGIQCRPQVALVMMVLGVAHRRVAPTVTLGLGLARRHQSVEVKFVSVPLSVDFGHDVFVVVIPVKQQLRTILLKSTVECSGRLEL